MVERKREEKRREGRENKGRRTPRISEVDEMHLDERHGFEACEGVEVEDRTKKKARNERRKASRAQVGGR